MTPRDPLPELMVCIRTFGRVLVQTGLYSLDHPTVRASLDLAHRELSTVLDRVAELAIHVNDNRLCANGTPIDGLGPLEPSLVALLAKHRLDSVEFRRDVGRDDLAVLCEALGARPEVVTEAGGVGGWLEQRSVTLIRCNEAVYAKLHEGETPDPRGTSDQGDGEERGREPERLVVRLEQMSLEDALTTIIRRAVPDQSEQRRVFELVFRQIRHELETKVHEATTHLEAEKQQ
ncbi:MAG: hypothetical protein HY207_11755, partial [Nitrospirae bacterium]|nr:hypothetical protein [Nitrospirota bacterium]